MADYIDRKTAIAVIDEVEAGGISPEAYRTLRLLPSPWVSVEDVLPPGGKDVLLAIGKADVFMGYYVGGRYYDSEGCGTYGVTHWMPLPDAPEVE